MRVVFFGTPRFALPTLQRLLESGRHSVAAVVTRPDRPRGRSTQPLPSPVKELALTRTIPVLQPERPQDPSFLEALRSGGAACGVVVAYGRILPQEVLRLFPKGAYNLHASLLPKYRGAAPIAWAVLRGEEETGVTIFRLDERLDHGPILLQERRPIGPDDTAASLAEDLAQTGSVLFLKAMDQIENGDPLLTPQEESASSQAPRLTKKDGVLRWEEGSPLIDRQIRAVQPWPGAITWWKGNLLKILAAEPDPERDDPDSSPGTVVRADPDLGIWIQTGAGQIRIDALQMEGGKGLKASEFLRGHPLRPGDRLTSSPDIMDR